MSTPTTTRAAGRPPIIDNPVRRSLMVDEAAWDAAGDKARGEGRSLAAAVRELVEAYAEGRVRIAKAPKR